MGREVRRMPLDFEWPLDKVWDGFLMPQHLHSIKCEACDGTGHNPETKEIDDDFYDFADTGRRWCNDITQDEVDALVVKGRLYDLTHSWAKGEGWKRDDSKPRPTAEQVNAWNQRGMGHDGINRWILIEARAKRLGVWGQCDNCKGEGEIFANDQHRREHDDWEPTELPSGDGYQIWETTTEGSPKTPVFANPEDLAQWCTDNGVSSFGHQTEDYDTWLAFIRGPGWAPTMILDDGGIHSGVAAASK